MFKQHEVYKQENNLDSFFGQNHDEVTRKELLDRISDFVKAPDWSLDQIDENKIDRSVASNADEILQMNYENSLNIIKSVNKEEAAYEDEKKKDKNKADKLMTPIVFEDMFEKMRASELDTTVQKSGQ